MGVVYDRSMATTKRPLQPGADTALAKLAQIMDRGRKAETAERARLEKHSTARAKAIHACRDVGWTYEAIADELGLTKQRIQAMAQYKIKETG